MEAAASPLPSEDTTPPVTKIYFADIDSSVVEICAAGDCVLSALFSGEPGAPAFWRDQGGARKRARAIMTGNASGGKKDLLPEAFLCRRKLLAFEERPLVHELAAGEGKHACTHQH